MSFIESIKSMFNLNISDNLLYRAVVLGDKGIYIENVVRVKSYSDTLIELGIKGGIIIIKGVNLIIKKYYQKDLLIVGKVVKWELKQDA